MLKEDQYNSEINLRGKKRDRDLRLNKNIEGIKQGSIA